MKKIIYTILLFFISIISVKADTIYNIDMDIKIEKDGTAKITETWDVKASGGTEWYKQINNLGNSRLSNFTVSMDGKPLTGKTWNVNESLKQKAGYYGINYTSEGLELCFGKSNMRRHTFTLNYKLSNYVFNTQDSQVLYWTLFPKVTTKKFSVTISSYYDFPDTLDVWGYGYKGYAYVENGKIKMSNEGKLKNDYVVILAKFPLNTYDNTNAYSYFNTFEDVYDMAEEGTFDYDYNDNSNFYTQNNVMILVYSITIVVGMLIIVIFAFVSESKKTNSLLSKNLKKQYGYIGNKKIDKKNVPMFREIPCNKDIYYANALIQLNNFKSKESNVMGAIILKWIKEKKIALKKVNDNFVFDLTLEPVLEIFLEKELFIILYEASKDGILEVEEFEKWCRKNYSRYLRLVSKFQNSGIEKLKQSGHIYKRTDRSECKKKNVMDDKIYEDSIKLYGLKKFLQEFSRIDTREVMEVHIWEEYLMFAYLFGIADKVAKQLKDMYPEVWEQEQRFDYDTILLVHNISIRSVSIANGEKSTRGISHERRASNSYSSGGGGGGSFGGGGSMGGR